MNRKGGARALRSCKRGLGPRRPPLAHPVVSPRSESWSANRGMADVDQAAPIKFDLSARARVLMMTRDHLALIRRGGMPDVVDVHGSLRLRKLIRPSGQNQFDFVDAGSTSRLSSRQNRVRVRSDFARRFNVIRVVQSLTEKYLTSAFQKSMLVPRPSHPEKRGGSRSSRTLGWDAVDAAASARRHRRAG